MAMFAGHLRAGVELVGCARASLPRSPVNSEVCTVLRGVEHNKISLGVIIYAIHEMPCSSAAS